MGKRDPRQYQHAADTNNQRWNIVELESRRQLRRKVNELIELVDDPTITTSEMRERLLLCAATFGEQFAIQLARSLHLVELVLDARDPLLDHPAIGFDLGLARPTEKSEAAALPLEMRP